MLKGSFPFFQMKCALSITHLPSPGNKLIFPFFSLAFTIKVIWWRVAIAPHSSPFGGRVEKTKNNCKTFLTIQLISLSLKYLFGTSYSCQGLFISWLLASSLPRMCTQKKRGPLCTFFYGSLFFYEDCVFFVLAKTHPIEHIISNIAQTMKTF